MTHFTLYGVPRPGPSTGGEDFFYNILPQKFSPLIFTNEIIGSYEIKNRDHSGSNIWRPLSIVIPIATNQNNLVASPSQTLKAIYYEEIHNSYKKHVAKMAVSTPNSIIFLIPIKNFS